MSTEQKTTEIKSSIISLDAYDSVNAQRTWESVCSFTSENVVSANLYTADTIRTTLDKITEWKGEGEAPKDYVQLTEKVKEEIEELFGQIEQERYEAKRKMAKAKSRFKAAKKLRDEFELYLRLTG